MYSMKIKLIIVIVISCTFISYATPKLGVTRLYSLYQNAFPQLHTDLEDEIMATISDVQKDEVYALGVKETTGRLRKMIAAYSTGESGAQIIPVLDELHEVDYCLAFDVMLFKIYKERDFYDVNTFFYNFDLRLTVILIDCNNNKIIDENVISVEFKKEDTQANVITHGIRLLKGELFTYLNESALFQLKVHPVKINPIFIHLDKGKKDGIKPQDVLAAYDNNDYRIKHNTVVRVVKADEDTAVANILYTNDVPRKNAYFTKMSFINLEIQVAGGFVLGDVNNNISTKNDMFSFLSSASLRALIPVGLAFFRPVVQFEFNFFYLTNRLIIPFSFETGCQGEIRIHRFQLDPGLLIGALFAPDEENNYYLDSVVIRPYIHASVLTSHRFKLFAEYGYKFYMQNIFYNEFKIDLKGMYFSFGFAINV